MHAAGGWPGLSRCVERTAGVGWPGASGNIVMDDLCFMLDSMGLRTGVDLERLLQVRHIVHAALPDIEMHGALARAGLPRNYVRAGEQRAA